MQLRHKTTQTSLHNFAEPQTAADRERGYSL
jgi:hypothetical protein